MNLDIVVPGKEEALYKRAVSMGKVPVFLYADLDFNSLKLRLNHLCTFEDKTYKTAFLLAPKSPDKMSFDKRIRKEVDFVVGTSQDLKTIRALIEKGNIDFFTDISSSGGRDHTHYRRSNFNQVIAKIAKENNVSYLIDFSRIKKLEGNKRSTLIGRISQNAEFCRKAKVPIKVMSFARTEDELVDSHILDSFEKIL